MVNKQLYKRIGQKYGEVASWAVWAKADSKPKSNIADMEIFNLKKNPSILHVLRTDVVMVGLNFSRGLATDTPFLNFHDASPYGHDYKIRFAFEGTKFYGAYMTDIIKDFTELDSRAVLKQFKENPDQLSSHIDAFQEELSFIGSFKPLILAFGRDAYEIIRKNMNQSLWSDLICLTHYSHRISKEKYRMDTHDQIDNALSK